MSRAGMSDKYKHWFEKYSYKSLQKNDFVHMKTRGPMSALQSCKFVSGEIIKRTCPNCIFIFINHLKLEKLLQVLKILLIRINKNLL